MKSINTLLAIVALALSATQLSCSVNDYCLNCATDDGGTDDDANDADMPVEDAPPDAGCVPTGPEVCDDVDNDCNGLKDDGTVEQVGDPCANQMGVCAGGTKICTAGQIKCTLNASPEICDNLDNNCNNVVDEGDPGGGGICGTEQGECQAGTLRCAATANCLTAANCDPLTQNCCVKCQTPSGAPWVGSTLDDRLVPETCNAKDDNCNGLFDEGLSSLGACGPTTNDGVCVIGTKACVGGNEQCNGAVFPGFESCNGLDDDCDENQVGGGIDEPYNKNIDVLNCGTCGNKCTMKTCILSSENGTTCSLDSDCAGGGVGSCVVMKTCTKSNENGTYCVQDTDCAGGVVGSCVVNSQPCCGPGCAPSKPNNANGTCSFECNVGFIDLNGNAADGCEYKCSPTGVEECDGVDNDCDGTPDDGLTPPVGLCLTQGVCAGSTAICAGAGTTAFPTGGWVCSYAALTIYEKDGEVSCDGLNNDCDANIDESHVEKGLACFDNQPSGQPQDGVCRDEGVYQCNSAAPKGPLICRSPPESGAECLNNTDDNANGKVNDGCPQVGATAETGTQCDDFVDSDTGDTDSRVNDGCPLWLPDTLPGTETCNGKDDDCDGAIDQPTAGVLAGQDWVRLANGVQMMKYEASRPDSTSATSGLSSATVCSRALALPWTNVTYPQAQAACASVGGRLCTEAEWHHACSVVPTPTVPSGPVVYSVVTAGTVIEAEDYTDIKHGTVPAAAESGCAAGTTVDDDRDGTINDGCPVQGPANPPIPELCSDNADNDGDTFVNDGCPAIAAQTRAWVHDYTFGFSGISAMEALLNTTGGGVPIANAIPPAPPLAGQSPRLSYSLNVTQASASYRVWVKMYQSGLVGDNDEVYVRIDNGALATVTPPAPVPTSCTMDSECSALTGGTCVDIDASGTKDVCAGWRWVVAAATFNLTGPHTLDVLMGDDGVKIDKVALNISNTTAPADTTATPKGNTWAYATNANVASDTTCNGHERTAANDDVLTTGSLGSCFADNAGANDMFDMSGNVKEWTAAQKPGVNPLRGGASNSTTVGTSCALNFTVADDALLFPNIGFRCCK